MTLPDNGNSLPSVQVEAFDGPLDLLLDEVRRQNVAIEKIAMAPIVARFLEYVRTAAERNLNLDIEWLHMAATLIHWKSRSLLPSDAMTEPAADPTRDSLVQQLLAHRKQVAEELARRRAVEQAQVSRVGGEFREAAGPDEPEDSPFVSVWDLMQQARDLSRWVQEHRESHRQWKETLGVEKDDVTVSDMIDYLWARLGSADVTLDGATLINEQPCASRKANLFLGMLELVRDQQLQIEQSEFCGPVWLSRRSRENA
jgi:segregation and condensation protein A